MEIEIYTRPGCPYCVAAINLLEEKKLKHKHHELQTREEVEALKEKTGFMTVPQIFIDGKLIGGYTELKEWVEKNR